MNYRTPEGHRAMREAADATHKWFMEEATPEEQDAFLHEIEGQYWDPQEKPQEGRKSKKT